MKSYDYPNFGHFVTKSLCFSRNFRKLQKIPRTFMSMFLALNLSQNLLTLTFYGTWSSWKFTLLNWSEFSTFSYTFILSEFSTFSYTFVTFVFGCVVVEFCFWVTYFYYFEQWWLSSIIPQIFILLKSLHTVWYKCAVSRSQPCISRYYRPCGSFYIFATGGCYAGSLPLLGSRLSISHWRTRT